MKMCSPLYYVRAIAPDEDKITIRSFSNRAREVFQSFNSALFKQVEYEHPGSRRYLLSDGTMIPLPRLYIAKNRTPLENARDDPKAVLAVITNVELTKSPVDPRLSRMTAKCFLVKPIGPRHDMETPNIGVGSDPNMPISWIKVKIVKNVGYIEVDVTKQMEEKVLRRGLQTSRLDLIEGDKDYAVNETFIKTVLGFNNNDNDDEPDPLKRIMARLREGEPNLPVIILDTHVAPSKNGSAFSPSLFNLLRKIAKWPRFRAILSRHTPRTCPHSRRRRDTLSKCTGSKGTTLSSCKHSRR